jgi:hypothetical protein
MAYPENGFHHFIHRIQLMNESFFWFASKAEIGCEILKNTEDGNRYKQGCNCKYW